MLSIRASTSQAITSRLADVQYLKHWIFCIFRAMRTIWQNLLIGDSLPKRAKMSQPTAMPQLSMENAEEPKYSTLNHG